MTRRVLLFTLIFPFLFISSMHATIFTRENDLHAFTYVSRRSAIQCTRWWCDQKENKRKTHIPLMCNLSQIELARSQMVVIYRKWSVLYHHGNRIDQRPKPNQNCSIRLLVSTFARETKTAHVIFFSYCCSMFCLLLCHFYLIWFFCTSFGESYSSQLFCNSNWYSMFAHVAQ